MLGNRFSFLKNWDAALLAAVAGAVLLRLTGIDYGLPAVFNGDEPHHVNVAVSFARGTLNPGVFKYPTLWMYALFGSYGIYFLSWSGLGLLHTAREFGELFVWNPTGFFLIGRLLASVFSLAALAVLYRSGSRLGGRTGLWAVALAAVSPTLVESAHAAKPESMMFFWAACAWLFALRYHDAGRRRDLAICAAAAGLAVSTQYTAAPLCAVVPSAWWARRMVSRQRLEIKELLLCSLAVPAAFFIGSPFILLDWPAFLTGLQDNWAAYGADAGSGAGLTPLVNLLTLPGSWLGYGLLFLFGAFLFVKRDRPRAVLLLVPSAVYVLFFAFQAEGGWRRYLLGCFPAVALVSGTVVESLLMVLKKRRGGLAPAASWAALALLMLPGGAQSWGFDRLISMPDTRSLAAGWIAARLPEGTVILSDQDADSPRIMPNRAHAERLRERTKSIGHPRARYYELMLSGHPGGGQEVYQVYREAGELHSGPSHTEWSAQGRPVVDGRRGLAPALRRGVSVVVLTSYGAAHEASVDVYRYVGETRRRGRKLIEFAPVPGLITGPRIEIYRIGKKK